MSAMLDFDAFDADSALAPSPSLGWRECFGAAEFAMAWLASPSIDHWPRGDGHPVIVYPGFLAGSGSTRFLRRLLQTLGYAAYDWEQGLNVRLTDSLAQRALEHLQRVQQQHQAKATLIGWSAGGVYARELAREHPELVRNVITMGSPIRGNYKVSRSWWLWSKLHPRTMIDAMFSEAACAARAEPLPVPTTCIYSHLDGIVPWACCTSLPASRTENVEVHCTHTAFGHNLETLHVIADRLALPEQSWRPYRQRAHSATRSRASEHRRAQTPRGGAAAPHSARQLLLHNRTLRGNLGLESSTLSSRS